MSELNHLNPSQAPVYQLRLKSQLDLSWADWFEGMTMSHAADGSTVLLGTVMSQATLHGLLNKIRDLGLTLLDLRQIPAPAAELTSRDRMLMEVAARYGIEVGSLNLLTDNPNDGVYGFVRHGQKFILKCRPAAVYRKQSLDHQVDWINFLAEQGASVCRAVYSSHGRLIEQISVAGQTSLAVCYEHAPGERPAGSVLTSEFFQTWGRLMGRIHRLTAGYRVTPVSTDGDVWHVDNATDNATMNAEILADQPYVLERYKTLLTWCRTLPTDASAFGLVHNDFQLNNVHLDRGASGAQLTLTAFDFDDCELSWFASDIATALYFTMWEPHPDYSNATFAALMLENFLEGYAQERLLAPFWIEQIPMFLKRQEMRVYLIISQQYRNELRERPEALQPKLRALLDRYRQNIEQDIPYIESAYNPWRDNVAS